MDSIRFDLCDAPLPTGGGADDKCRRGRASRECTAFPPRDVHSVTPKFQDLRWSTRLPEMASIHQHEDCHHLQVWIVTCYHLLICRYATLCTVRRVFDAWHISSTTWCGRHRMPTSLKEGRILISFEGPCLLFCNSVGRWGGVIRKAILFWPHKCNISTSNNFYLMVPFK